MRDIASKRRGVRNRLARLPSDRDGASAIEFALILPFLTMILFGIIQFGMVFAVQNTMVNAAREAARLMAVEQAGADKAEALAQERLQTWDNLSFDIQATEPNPGNPNDKDVTVTIRVPMSDAMMIDILGLGTGRQLEARSVMRRESS